MCYNRNIYRTGNRIYSDFRGSVLLQKKLQGGDMLSMKTLLDIVETGAIATHVCHSCGRVSSPNHESCDCGSLNISPLPIKRQPWVPNLKGLKARQKMIIRALAENTDGTTTLCRLSEVTRLSVNGLVQTLNAMAANDTLPFTVTYHHDSKRKGADQVYSVGPKSVRVQIEIL